MIDFSKVITADVIKEKFNAEIRSQYEYAVQEKLDSKAKEYGYDTILTAISYADEPSVAKFQKEGKALRQWRSKVWEYAYNELELVTSGKTEQPTLKEFIENLPDLVMDK